MTLDTLQHCFADQISNMRRYASRRFYYLDAEKREEAPRLAVAAG